MSWCCAPFTSLPLPFVRVKLPSAAAVLMPSRPGYAAVDSVNPIHWHASGNELGET